MPKLQHPFHHCLICIAESDSIKLHERQRFFMEVQRHQKDP